MAEDPELAAIRARRLAEMQAQAQSRGEDDQRRAAQEEEMRHAILSRILTSEARQRLLRIAMVKPERARSLEMAIITGARSGQLRGSTPTGQLTEADLIRLLENVVEDQASAATRKIQFQRRNDFDADDDF